MTHPHPHSALASRLDELEIKASFAEDLLEQLNLTIYKQQQQIELLQRQINHLRKQLPEPDPAQGTTRQNASDERPPHY
ncbi:SlyX [Hylemonella gracilis str. Niagara R]|uniref:SlyX n=1 Tax=Hylemonella gracilis str. Niagara R TaxID=1458275 RepID=A0A016XD50_9BURK|nr:SlyX family protein [Hylemonella gracilis]EYC49840.1 SlyX [Hylemonella gracilis str. Niagara R]